MSHARPALLLGVALGAASFTSAIATAAPVTVPPVVYAVEAVHDHNKVDVGTADLVTSTFTPVLDDLPLGPGSVLAADPESGRWAVSFQQLDNGAPLVIDGAAVTKPSDVSVIVIGKLGQAKVAVLPGDPRCHNKKRACFEDPVRFAAGGTVLVTQSLASSWWMWNWRSVADGAKATARPLIDARLAKTGASLQVSADGTQAIYQGTKGLFITAWPSVWTGKPLVKRAKVASGAPPMIMSDAFLVGGQAIYFRRDPADQKVGMIAATDPKSKIEKTVFPMPEEYPMWHHRVLGSAPRATAIFQHDTGFELAEIFEVPLETLVPRLVTSNVKELLDVSADGSLILCSAYTEVDPKTRKAFEQVLLVVELATGKVVARSKVPVPGAKFYDARFVGK